MIQLNQQSKDDTEEIPRLRVNHEANLGSKTKCCSLKGETRELQHSDLNC